MRAQSKHESFVFDSFNRIVVCAQPESTRGHYSVVAAVTERMVWADLDTRTEVRVLTEPNAWPADIYTAGAILGARLPHQTASFLCFF